MPLELVHIWDWFTELDATRGSNGFGPNPITYREILAWAALTGARPFPSEVRLIMTLDGLYREAFAKASEARQRFEEQKRAQQSGR